MSVRVLHGDMRELVPPLSGIDACVTDPPYHLTSIVKRFGSPTAVPTQFGKDGAFARASRGFMGKQWDGGDIAFQPETWRLVYDAMKPGAHLAAFGGTRTYHRMACAIEDAGFEVRDTLFWLYGSGFPKSHDVSKAIDKTLGAVRPVIGKAEWSQPAKSGHHGGSTGEHIHGDGERYWPDVTGPATPEAAQWAGWGTALKPAVEPIILARKPLVGSVAQNVLQHGTGGINVDACRVPGIKPVLRAIDSNERNNPILHTRSAIGTGELTTEGRWPANVLHDGSPEVLAAFAAFGEKPTGTGAVKRSSARERNGNQGPAFGDESRPEGTVMVSYADTGTAARFFYTAKADASDRAGSKHPTVKPLDLIRWLCRLITPPGGTILDPFAGSGTTGEAARLEGFSAILIEREADYIADIHRRLGRASGADAPLFAAGAA